MPHSLKKRRLTLEMIAGLEHWRWVEDQLHPIPEVTAPRYSEEWMEEVDRRNQCRVLREVAEERYIERMRRMNRCRIIDRMLQEANAEAAARAAARQKVIDRLKRIAA